MTITIVSEGQRQLVATGLGPTAIGARIGCAKGTVCKWQRGTQTPEAGWRHALDAAFGIHVASWSLLPALPPSSALAALRATGVDSAELSRLLDCSAANASAWLSGKVTPSLEWRANIEATFATVGVAIPRESWLAVSLDETSAARPQTCASHTRSTVSDHHHD